MLGLVGQLTKFWVITQKTVNKRVLEGRTRSGDPFGGFGLKHAAQISLQGKLKKFADLSDPASVMAETFERANESLCDAPLNAFSGCF